MISYRVGYDALWSVSQAPYERVKWFNRVVTAHNKSVRYFWASGQKPTNHILF
jgi:hypothetical protein